MNILFVNAGAYINMDMMSNITNIYRDVEVEELGYFFGDEDKYYNERFEKKLRERFDKKKYDLVISTNFYPVLARHCHSLGLKYIAWSYDTPMNMLPCDEMRYDTNSIFLFDRAEVEQYRGLGLENFYHMPLAIDTDRLDQYRFSEKYASELSFVGRLYRPQLQKVKKGLSQELISYIDKLVQIQRGDMDRYVLDDLISQPIIDEINRQYRESGRSLQIRKEHLSFTVSEYVTYIDRLIILEMMARRFDTHLYSYEVTEEEKELLKNVKIHGEINYFTDMPVMFKSSKINLCTSFRAARSAIPLRALDIMGCGAFLLSSPQPELLEHFEDGKSVAVYHSEEEAIEKAEYYLNHEGERQKIARAGYEIVKRDFRYEDRFRKMFEIAKVKVE
ncbi:CgeB family protein [Butyrivibrio fibrisolvens]|uniref:CgeB family protein n=1 Tax=Butyrivibrio fibrisolvens TaxID=831 RepID=UPI0004831AA6|nr:glycosyltransferase [Butyrivibrio fibrisolvens]